MTEEEIRRIMEEALLYTSAKDSQISLVVKQSSAWVIILQDGQEEVAIKVESTPNSTPSSLQKDFIQEVSKLF